jgi:hypothetical protein
LRKFPKVGLLAIITYMFVLVMWRAMSGGGVSDKGAEAAEKHTMRMVISEHLSLFLAKSREPSCELRGPNCELHLPKL